MMTNIKLVLLLVGVTIHTCTAPPVTANKKEANEDEQVNGLEDYMEYHRYLKEVVHALESDPEFRQKLQKADESEIKSGKIADELEFVSHHVRTRLDEIKRVELERLKELTEKKRKLLNNVEEDDPMHHHLDHANPHTFEIEDLKKLIAKTTEDLNEADRKRREEFKQYEMQKEFDKQDKLNHTNGADKEKLEKEFKEREEKHKKHEKLHEPGHKAQLEEVWQEQDQMQQDFDPKTFFMLHDLDGNGLWDQGEVKALFIKELDKMYQQGAPEDDMRERVEEMERMRETVFGEMDNNKDGFIDFDEFLMQTKSNDFKQDHGWQGLDEQKPYTDEELAEYIRQHQMNQIPQGYPGGYAPQPVYYNPNMPQQGYHPPPHPQQGYHPNAVPNPNYHYQQAPPNYQQHPNPAAYQNHVPVQQQHPNMQQQQHMPPSGVQQHQNVPPQQQFNAPQTQQANIPPQQQGNAPQQPQQANIPPQQQFNAPQQQANAPQQQANVPQQKVNAPQQANAPQQQNNAPQQQFNAPQQANVPQQQNIPSGNVPSPQEHKNVNPQVNQV